MKWLWLLVLVAACAGDPPPKACEELRWFCGNGSPEECQSAQVEIHRGLGDGCRAVFDRFAAQRGLEIAAHTQKLQALDAKYHAAMDALDLARLRAASAIDADAGEAERDVKARLLDAQQAFAELDQEIEMPAPAAIAHWLVTAR